MGFDDRDLRSWSVRDSRKPMRWGSSLLSSVDDTDLLKKSGSLTSKSFQKQYKLPPQSPRSSKSGGLPSDPKLELTIMSLSPRPSSGDESSSSSKANPARKCPEKFQGKFQVSLAGMDPRSFFYDFMQFAIDRIQMEENTTESAPDCGEEKLDKDKDGTHDDRMFPGMDLENHKDMLREECEIDFWDCQKEASYFNKAASLRDTLVLHQNEMHPERGEGGHADEHRLSTPHWSGWKGVGVVGVQHHILQMLVWTKMQLYNLGN